MPRRSAIASICVKLHQRRVHGRRGVSSLLRDLLSVDLYRDVGKRLPSSDSEFRFDVHSASSVPRILEAFATEGDTDVTWLVRSPGLSSNAAAASVSPIDQVAQLVRMRGRGGTPAERRAFADDMARVLASASESNTMRSRSRSLTP